MTASGWLWRWFHPAPLTLSVWRDPVADTLERLALAVRRIDGPPISPRSVPVVARLARREQWRVYTQVFVMHGAWCRRLFSFREMRSTLGLTRGDWEDYTGLLEDGHVIAQRERGSTRWVGPWNAKRVRRYIKYDLLDLPYPVAFDPSPLSLVGLGTNGTGTAGAQ